MRNKAGLLMAMGLLGAGYVAEEYTSSGADRVPRAPNTFTPNRRRHTGIARMKREARKLRNRLRNKAAHRA